MSFSRYCNILSAALATGEYEKVANGRSEFYYVLKVNYYDIIYIRFI